jgi:hypothetical protein
MFADAHHLTRLMSFGLDGTLRNGLHRVIVETILIVVGMPIHVILCDSNMSLLMLVMQLMGTRRHGVAEYAPVCLVASDLVLQSHRTPGVRGDPEPEALELVV